MSELSKFQKEVGEWAKEVFKRKGLSALPSLFNHLKKKIEKLKKTINRLNKTAIKNELTDCYLILLDIGHISLIDVHKAGVKKLAKNRNRKWGNPDNDGVIEHVKE